MRASPPTRPCPVSSTCCRRPTAAASAAPWWAGRRTGSRIGTSVSAWPRPGAVASVGSRGDSYDNALAATIIGTYKAELITQRGPWQGFESVEFATLCYVDWFNNRRLLEPIGNIPPAEAEARYYAAGKAPALAA